jgi:hypothetical protein
MKSASMLAAAALTAAASLTALPAAATIIQYTTVLTGPQEAPPNTSPATGAALVTVDDTAFTMRLEVGFNGLLGDTTAAHIHCCVAPPGTAPVATPVPSFPGFPTGVKAGFYDQTFDMSQASSYNPAFLTANGGTPDSAFASLLDGLNSGEAYLNIHTNLYPAGEIRGFLLPVPEPESYAMFAAALGLVALAKRRQGGAG